MLQSDGCTWTGELCNLEKHFDFERKSEGAEACQYFPIKCDYCTNYERCKDMELHMEQTNHKPANCEFCGFKIIPFYNLDFHYKTCTANLVRCSNINCPKYMRKLNLEAHFNKCPWSHLECEYKHAGCNAKIFRKDMEDHMEKNMKRHLKLVNAKCRQQEMNLCKN